jgi:hypothetical protein
VFILAFISLSASAKERPRETVTVVENESTTTAYDWQMDGKSSVSCYGSSCSIYYRPPTSGTQKIQGAILRLKRSDDSVVIAQCVAKADVLSNVVLTLGAMATNDSAAPTVYRNCRIPEVNSILEVEFNRSQVKIFMRAPSIDGTGRVSSETYYIKGVLRPSPQPQQAFTTSVQSGQVASHGSDAQQLEMVNRQLEEWDRRDHGLSIKIDTLRKSCPPPTTDEVCLRAEREYVQDAIPVFEAGIPLAERRLSLLNTWDQDAAAKQAEDETSKAEEGMKQALLSLKMNLAELDTRLAAAAIPIAAGPINSNMIPRTTPPQSSELALKLPSLTSGNLDLMRADNNAVKVDAVSAPVFYKSFKDTTTKPASAARPFTLQAAPQSSEAVLPLPGSTSGGPNLNRVDKMIVELDATAKDLSIQWAMFQKDCPDPTTDEICVDDKRQVALAMIENSERMIRAIDERVSLLNARPQDAASRQAENEAVETRAELKTRVDNSKVEVARLEGLLAELKQIRENR